MKILMVDIGGTTVTLMASGHEGFRKFESGRPLTPKRLIKEVIAATEDWQFEGISLAFPGIVRDGKVATNPRHLGKGWIGFDFEKEFKLPVRFINDAAMQALSAYESGRLLLLSLGTSVGAAVIADDVIVPIEVGMMPLSKSEAMMDRLTDEARKKAGRRRWQRAIVRATKLLRGVFYPDRLRLTGANVKHLDELPEGCEHDEHATNFRGALRLWPGADMLATSCATTLQIQRKHSKAQVP